ncbi:uncharacterized protein LOC131691174 [Topomyia yanbarensis]|uniref:uncharacterized protein LOC131691174 n=1 Tax=Topomyia yanbarensis TaxID=2498891 RepID=UPI00273B12B1|nr:uncharacterized protein LOC131691174 [Topomyia yanbarensis]
MMRKNRYLITGNAVSRLYGNFMKYSNYCLQHNISNEFLDGVVHTEDGFVANAVYAKFYQATDLTESRVRSLFTRFGPVESVLIYATPHDNVYNDTKTNNGSKRRIPENNLQKEMAGYAIISYKNCADAASCLKQNSMLYEHCYIAMADSWHQESYKHQVSTESNANINAATSGENHPIATNSQQVDFLHLNDYCLMLIFEKLDCFDLIALKKTCCRFEGIACDILKPTISMLDFNKQLIKKELVTLLDAKSLLTDVGLLVDHLSIDRTRFSKFGERILSRISRYCPNLTELSIHHFTLTSYTMRSLAVVFKSLVGLSLINCNIDDKIGRSLKSAVNLQRLDLSRNPALTGKCLSAVKNLKYLNLEMCYDIKGQPFSDFASKNSTLEYLNIVKCVHLTTDAINSISIYMTELSSLAFSNDFKGLNSSSMAKIAELPKLKEIKIKCMFLEQPVDLILRKLVEVDHLESLILLASLNDYNLLCGLTQLKKLKLDSALGFSDQQLSTLGSRGSFIELGITGRTQITGNQLIEFIKTNPQLQLLDISDRQISNGFIFSAIEILNQQACNRQGTVRSGKLKLIVNDTRLFSQIQQDSIVQNNRHLLEISYSEKDPKLDLNMYTPFIF